LILLGLRAQKEQKPPKSFKLEFKKIKPVYLFATFFLMLASILLAQAISLLFGYSVEQFKFSGGFSFTAGIFPAWFMLFLAPIIEELAWHTYGTDCLRQRFNLIKTSLMFAIFWAFWHLPLSFIKDYYQANLAEEGLIHSLNFGVSLIPYVILMNWLYYKTDRNILVAIVFHISAGFFNEIFLTHPDSKVIQTILLLVLTVFIVVKERDFFFKRDILLDYQR
jgi:membrane protease YdiL (CAAX protease family)